MQFLPSVKSSELMSKSAYESYSASKERRLHQMHQMGHSHDGIHEIFSDPEQNSFSPPTTPKPELFRSPSSAPMRQTAEFYLGPPPVSKSVGHRRKISVPECLPSFVNGSGSGKELSPVWVPQIPAPGAPELKRKISPASLPTPQISLVGRSPTFAAPTERRKSVAPLVRQYSQTGPVSIVNHHENMEQHFSRFGRLLRSLRSGSRTSSPEMEIMSPGSSESSPSSPVPKVGKSIAMSQSWHPSIERDFSGPGISDSESSVTLEADLMLWRKRSKGSLRRHEVCLHLLHLHSIY